VSPRDEKIPSHEIGYDGFEKSEEELLCNYGEAGRIFYRIVRLEGCAIWIPEFVTWLFENYDVKLSSAKRREP
jgi:hypothetical protein